ncbi:MAG: hypothetical protein JWM68_747 [Verrucomicrobiales bacterium]|nr:hypothetical protein [Verrucomicrobiales bacterium]
MKTSDCFFRRGGGFIFIAVFLFLPWNSYSAAGGSDSPFLQRVWQGDNGLPHDSVQAILQTHDGYLWIGTRRGLARFDGMRFTLLEMPEIARESIFCLCEDRNGNLWVGTEKGVLRLKDGATWLYHPVDGLAGDNVRTIYEGKDGSIWIGTTGGLSQFRDGKFYNFTRNEGVSYNVIRSVCEDDIGNLWIATDGGLCRLKDGIISVPDMARRVGSAVRSLCLDADRNLWVGTRIGLYRKKGEGWDHFNKDPGPLSDDFVNTVYADRNRQLWVGTYGGLNRMVDGKIVTELTSEGAAYDLVNAILEDREGSFWIGSKEGLTRLKPRSFTTITKQQGLTYNNVMCVLQDRSGNFWCGTWGGGLFRWKDQGNTASTITNSVANQRILSMCDGKDGSLWFGTDYADGLYRLKEGGLTHFDDKDGLEKVGIRVIYEDHERNLWIGTSLSLGLFKDGKFTRYTTKDGLAGEAVKVIFEDKEGDLWIGTSDGLSRRKNGKFTSFTTKDGFPRNPVLALYEDKENNLWIGTSGGGLNRLRNGHFTAYTTKEGLFNDEVLEILEDDYGNLWMSCLKGIFRVNKRAFDKFDRKEIESIPCTSYGKDDGMISIICNNVSKPAAWKGRDGRLWFATTKGLVVADPNIKANDTPPPVVIEEVLADKQRFESGKVGKRESESPFPTLSLARLLTIPPGRGELEIHYTALSFRASEKNRFKYKLIGVDPNWVDAGTRRIAYYNNIRPGNYSFHVVACNNDGVWNSSGANVHLTLQPHYWQTWWFKSFAIIGSLSVAAAMARYVTRKLMARKLDRLEQQHAIEKERTRIAQDMHDDLGSRLSAVLLLSGRAQQAGSPPQEVQSSLQKISTTVRGLVDSLDAIVWAVNPANDSLDRFAFYMYEYVQMYLEAAEIEFTLDVPDELPSHPLPSEVRHNLYLVVKESLNNVVKHSGATHVWFRLKVDGQALRIVIEDNGRGVADTQSSLFGNGLQNMEKRMRTIRGDFELKTGDRKGTQIWLRVLMNRKQEDRK